MDNRYIEKLRKKVKKELSDDKLRYHHTLGVANTSACLAMKYGADIEKAYIAGLLHDCAKCVPDNIKIKECESRHIEITDIEYESPYLLHSKLGAIYAKEKYNIEDEEICSAIKYHTTGKPNMSLLEKIVFIADYIEPYRNKASDLDEIRGIVFNSIDDAIYICLKDTIDYLKRTDKSIDLTTQAAFEFYKEKLEK